MNKEITEKDLKVKTTFEFDLTKLDPKKVLIGYQGLEPGSTKLDDGVHFKGRKPRKRNTILHRLEGNPFRYAGKNETHSNTLGGFIEIMGYDYSQRPPIIEYIPNGIRDKDTGETHFYVCHSGAHTGEALEEKNITEWIYDEYSYDNDAARQKHIAKINGTHPPSLISSPMDAINHTTKMINEEKLGLHEVDDYIKTTYAAVPGHGKIIATIKRQFTHRDETLYTSKDIKKFLTKKGLGTAGKIVNGKAHFACKEGYEDRHFMNCLKIWDEKGVSSHIHGYTKGSTDRHDIDEKRYTVLDEFDRLESAFFKLSDYCIENNIRKLPWKIKDFVKQKAEEGATDLIPVDKIKPRQNKISKLLGI